MQEPFGSCRGFSSPKALNPSLFHWYASENLPGSILVRWGSCVWPPGTPPAFSGPQQALTSQVDPRASGGHGFSELIPQSVLAKNSFWCLDGSKWRSRMELLAFRLEIVLFYGAASHSACWFERTVAHTTSMYLVVSVPRGVLECFQHPFRDLELVLHCWGLLPHSFLRAYRGRDRPVVGPYVCHVGKTDCKEQA